MPLTLPIELTPSQVRPVAYRVISKKHGLNLKSGALDVLADFLGHHYGADWRGARAERFLDEVARTWKDEDRGLFVDGPPLSQIISDLVSSEPADEIADANDGGTRLPLAAHKTSTDGKLKKFHWRNYFKVVNAEAQRRLVFKASTRHFELPPNVPPTLMDPGYEEDGAVPQANRGQMIGDSAALVNLFITRYNLLEDKIKRSEFFQRQIREDAAGGYELTNIKNMLGRPNATFFLFGLLTRPDGDGGDLYLTDPSGKIKLEITPQTGSAPDHYYTLGNFVVCHGEYLVDRFLVGTIGPPVAEPRVVTQEAYGSIDFYNLMNGGRSGRIERIDHQLQHAMVKEEQNLEDHRIVMLGCDIFLDKLPYIDALRRVLAEIARGEGPPLALVIAGSFISIPFQTNSISTYREAMNGLAQLFQGEPELAEKTKVILVPGDNDPWHAAYSAGATPLWPLQPVPGIFASRVNRSVADITWASNPSRLLYLSQEIVIVRDDYGRRFRSHDLNIAGAQAAPPGPIEIDDDDGAGAMDLEERTENLSDANSEVNNLDDDLEAAERKAALNSLVNEAVVGSQATQGTNISTSSDKAEARKVVATILDQCHLSPFSLNARPVVWEFDQALSLAQWPTTLLIMDPTTPRFNNVYEGCRVLNPGPFLFDGTANWIEFWPSDGRAEIKSINL